MTRRWGILLSACIILWCAPAGAATITVTTLADEQNANGQCSLREAVINANHDNQSGSSDCPAGSGGDTIVFKNDLTGTVTLGSALPSIIQSLTIKGRSDWSIMISGNYAAGIFEVGPGLTVNLRDLVIAKGSRQNGGGVKSSQSILNIDHCRFEENFARYGTDGGGIHNYEGTVDIADSEFLKNWANMGGGIWSWKGKLRVKKSKFEENEARVGSGIHNSGQADIEDSRFESNKIKSNGGGIANSGEMTVKNSTFSGHETDTGQGAGISNFGKAELFGVAVKNNRAGLGGGIYNTGTLLLSDATVVEDNRAGCSGGGIFNSENGVLEIKGEKGICKILNNEAVNDGGGIYSYKATVTISNGEISRNSVQAATGGGIYTYDDALDIRDTTVSHNLAGKGGGLYLRGGAEKSDAVLARVDLLENDAYGSGGGAYLAGGRVQLEDVRFEKNEAEKDGSGIYNAGTLRVARGNFTGNSFLSSVSMGNGGGISNEGDADIRDSLFFDNLLGQGGGLFNTGTLQITGCTFSRNGARGNGGAIYNRCIQDGVKIVNSTLSGNMTDAKGGGIFNEGTTVHVLSSTLSGNTEWGKTGNIYNAAGEVKLQNTLIDGSPTGSNCTGVLTSLGYNLSSDASCQLTQPTDLPNTAPLLGALADNGGPTQTQALLAGSPAIGKIPKNVSSCGTTVSTDQRGTARPQPSAGNCDIGSYEKKPIWGWPHWPNWPVRR